MFIYFLLIINTLHLSVYMLTLQFCLYKMQIQMFVFAFYIFFFHTL
uniref:Uncharacterized protein n=1 Tax=Symphyocladiella dendroidea TaxID=2506487 RepID=A0A1Z1M7F4_9FLOR|nr:hypothetical protein [Symphyocladiella dendroidea]ARW61946.1 hypothetical protein [Symphyocladiella dendroidea]